MLGFLFAVLLVIPLTIYLVQQQQNTQTQATPNTNLSFSPSSKTTAVGENISFDVILSPGSNQVNFVKLAIKFDPTKLSATEDSFEVNPASNLSIQEGPTVNNDVLLVVLTVGSDPTKVIQNNTKIGTVSFDVTGASDLPTQITFDRTQTQIRSINGANNDAFNENVLQDGTPAVITIQAGGQSGGTPTATPTPTLVNGAPTATPTPTLAVGATSGTNDAPICTSLGLDVGSTGVAPYTISFTADGTDEDGTIEKVTFNFGDGTIEDVTSGGGIGTSEVSSTLSHTYNSAESYTASAILTDNNSGTSSSVNCTASITVTEDSTSTDTDDTTDTTSDSTIEPSPLPATGPEEAIMGAGILGGILLVIGTLLFLAL